MAQFAINELEKIGFIEHGNLVDSLVVKSPDAYPAYFGTYNQFDIVRKYLDPVKNLYMVGRNGMHRYNNQDHSMLTAMAAVEAILNKKNSKEKIWKINTDGNYQESKE